MKISRELKIGVFVILVLALSFLVINFLRGKDLMNRDMELVSRFEDLQGLVPSDPVYIKGYKAGAVSSVDYDPESGMFDVSCSVMKKFRIPSDSRMTVYSRDIMGSKAVRIDLGVSGDYVSDGAVLQPHTQPDMLASISDSLVPVIEKLSGTLSSIDSVAVSVNAFLSESNRAAFSNTLANLEKTLSDARKISSAIGGKSEELSLFIENMSSLSSRLDSISEKADSSMTDVMSVTAALSAADIEGAVSSLHSLLESIQDPDGTVGKLLSDGSVYDSLDSFIADADSLLKKIQENPKKFIKISLF